MLEDSLEHPFFLNRHRQAPLLKERESFLSHLQQQGTSRKVLRNLFAELLQVVLILKPTEMREVSLVSWCAQIRSIPFKKSGHRPIGYLEKHEIDVLLAAPDRTSRLGSRDHALLLFLYNTGARADEAAKLTVGDLRLHGPQEKSQSFVQLRGTGDKIRFCPLWASTTAVLKELVRGRTEEERVFLGRSRRAITRFGVHDIVTRYARMARGDRAGLRHKRIGPNTIRHTTATHLLRAGVDINTIRAWLGHVSIDTTNIYAESDLEMKAKALGMCKTKLRQPRKRWRDNQDLLKFLA